MTETISIERDARGVATLWLDRADKHNAMSARMIAELHAAAEQLGADQACRVVVLAAKGRSFCAGGDLGWMREQFEAAPEVRGREAAKPARRTVAYTCVESASASLPDRRSLGEGGKGLVMGVWRGSHGFNSRCTRRLP